MRATFPGLVPSLRALIIAVFIGARLGFGGPEALGRGPSRPNILLLFADDQRADTIAAWGNPHIRTPNLDRLAPRRASLPGHYCLGPHSGALVGPRPALPLSRRPPPRAP